MRVDAITFVSELMRKELNVTQFSKVSGIPRQTLYQIKNGQRCSDAMGQKIADALGIPLDQLKDQKKSTC